MSIMSLAFSAGVIVGPVLGGVTSDRTISPLFDYGTPFVLVAALSLACACWTCVVSRLWPHRAATRASIRCCRCDHREAARQRNVAFLSVVFFLMQVGYGALPADHHAAAAGEIRLHERAARAVQRRDQLCFVFGLLFVVRRMLRVWRVVDIAKTGLLVAGVGQALSALFPHEPVLWALAMVVGCFDMVAYTTTYTAFSDAVSEDRQGWALGVAGPVMAVAGRDGRAHEPAAGVRRDRPAADRWRGLPAQLRDDGCVWPYAAGCANSRAVVGGLHVGPILSDVVPRTAARGRAA